jgi:tetratricopeptide (TPR) repeat protein
MMVAFSIAMRAKEGDLQEADLEGVFGQFGLSPVLANVCKATYLLETGRVAESLSAIDPAVQTLRKLGYSNEWDLARLELTRGDAAYKLERDELAIQAYRSGVAAAQQDSFEYAWCSWRLGTLSKDENLLSQAAAAFKSLNLNDMCARALGAQGAVLADAGDHARALSCFASVVSGYYESQIDEMGAPAAVALAHITRLRADLTGESLPGEAEFPAFETTAYETVIPTARPQGTHATACFLLGETYRASGRISTRMNTFERPSIRSIASQSSIPSRS